MGFFDKVLAAFSADSVVEECTVAPTASEYIEWLPRYMLRESQTEIRIDSARPLPGADEAPGVPDADAVLNRLKVLCGINPFRLSEPIEGAFERIHANHKLKFKTRFEDTQDRTICILYLSIRA